MKTFDIMQTRHIHVELSSDCNAGCPMCSRYKSGTNTLIPGLVPRSIRLPEWTKFLDDFDEFGFTDFAFTFCGCLGDPCMSPDFFEIAKETIRRGWKVSVVTNGSIGSPKKWEELGSYMTEPHQVEFSIDGLEDTNHLYRIGLSWNRIMANAKAFINAGGNASWKFIVFDHNKHQIEEARALAKDMGFTRFQEFISTRNQTRTDNTKSKIELTINTKKKQSLIPILDVDDRSPALFNKISKETANSEIVCEAKRKNTIFIDAQFKLWPCMFIGSNYFAGSAADKFMHDITPSDWNDLDKYTIDEILEHDFVKGLDKGEWTTTCTRHCTGGIHYKMTDASKAVELL